VCLLLGIIHVLFCFGSGSHLKAKAVWVEEVDRLDEMMVSHPKHFDASLLQSFLDRAHLIDRVYLKGEVMNPFWHVAAQRSTAAIANIEERDVRAVTHFEKEMTERCVLSCGWNALGANNVGQWQAQEIFIELPGLLSIDAAPSHVVETLEGDRSRCTMNRGHCRTPDCWRAGEDISSHRIRRSAIAALQTAVAAEVSSGVSREHNGRRNKGSPQVSSYLETCRDQLSECDVTWDHGGGRERPCVGHVVVSQVATFDLSSVAA
jgi:hypothetical protein